jgi:CO dehydrogenase/acetyl-CoA synthase gamma subunit (corrinoid Fe-S protein)
VLKGTTDIIICPRNYEYNNALRQGIQIVIELKKAAVNETDRHQVIVQLLSASAFSHFPVVAILTDLNKYW